MNQSPLKYELSCKDPNFAAPKAKELHKERTVITANITIYLAGGEFHRPVLLILGEDAGVEHGRVRRLRPIPAAKHAKGELRVIDHGRHHQLRHPQPLPVPPSPIGVGTADAGQKPRRRRRRGGRRLLAGVVAGGRSAETVV